MKDESSFLLPKELIDRIDDRARADGISRDELALTAFTAFFELAQREEDFKEQSLKMGRQMSLAYRAQAEQAIEQLRRGLKGELYQLIEKLSEPLPPAETNS